MLKGFEELTYELTEEEREVTKKVAAILNSKNPDGTFRYEGKGNAIKNIDIRRKLFLAGHNFKEPRIRKIIQAIRDLGLVPCLIANSRGYYITFNPVEMNDYMISIRQRISTFTNTLYNMQRDYSKYISKSSQQQELL